jgi:hypothetical protein
MPRQPHDFVKPLTNAFRYIHTHENALRVEAIIRTPLIVMHWVDWCHQQIGVPTYERIPDTMAKHQLWTFVNTRLTPEERDHFAEWYDLHYEGIYESLASILLDGYKLSLRYDAEHYTWLATLIGTEASPHNFGKSITSRHETMPRSIALLVYKHAIIADYGEWRDDSTQAAWG